MFLSLHQVSESLKYLESIHPFFMTTFLVFKKAELPVGHEVEIRIARAENQFLEEYYNPAKASAYYYRVSRVGARSKEWVDARKHASSTLQSTRTKGLISEAFIHQTNTNLWGWQPNYVEVLKSKLQRDRSGQIPVFHLAVWIYRERQWPPNTNGNDIINTLLNEFNITEFEKKELFDVALPDKIESELLFQEDKITWEDLQEVIGLPEDAPPETGGTLSLLELEGIGPAKKLRFEFADRVNLFTGDNGLGKTFILEAAWWALSGDWAGSPAIPRDDAKKNEPKITFQISGISGRPEEDSSHYDWKTQNWPSRRERLTIPGLLIYARVDGAFAVWDPATSVPGTTKSGFLILTREQVWDGLFDDTGGKSRSLFNGLIRDWVDWQNKPDKYPFKTLKKVLQRLSPPDMDRGDLGILEPGTPKRIPGDRRLIPTIKHPYGEIPLVHASAAVRRIVAMAYLIVWTWEEHKAQSDLIREKPQRRMVIILDEIEAHLHPQWQRIILPALLDVANDLEEDLQVQFLVATHSPLVLASIEPRFEAIRDKIFHLNLVRHSLFDAEAIVEEPEFIPYGSTDRWLRSNIFELKRARSIEAEQALEDAKKLQMRDTTVTDEEVREVSERLVKYLPPHDRFWPRWTFFAEKHGVEL